MMTAAEFLEAARRHLADRAALRDTPEGERSMARAVATFNAHRGPDAPVHLTEVEGWLFLDFLKLSRAAQGAFHRDDWEDRVGYSALAAEAAIRAQLAPEMVAELVEAREAALQARDVAEAARLHHRILATLAGMVPPRPRGADMGFDLDEIRARRPIADVIGARVEWDRRKTHEAKGDFWACCPFHQERTPSFHLDAGKGLWKCFGCGEGGDLFAFVQKIDGVDFATAVRRLAEDAGVSSEVETPEAREARSRARAKARAEAEQRDRAREARKREDGFAIWREAEADAPILRAYLAARGVRVESLVERLGGLPPTLRLHSDLPFWVRGRDGGWSVLHSGPAMVAAVGANGAFVGLHRTWITPAGRARVEGRKLVKRMLGPTFGSPVRFCPPTARMIVGEGIETVLCVWSRLLARGDDDWSAEAALSRDALCGPGFDTGTQRLNPFTGKPEPSPFPDLDQPAWAAPDCVDRLVILAEGSAKDPISAEFLTRRAVRRHAQRPNGHLRECEHRLPGGRWDVDRDFADLAAAENETMGTPTPDAAAPDSKAGRLGRVDG